MRKYLLVIAILTTGLLVAHSAPFSHEPFNRILSRHVKDGKVDYQAIKAEEAKLLAGYVRSLATADPESMSESEQKAFWLNAYNALVIHSVVQGHTPVEESKRQSFFRDRRFAVAGRKLTLDEIEHQGLRRLFKDPRIHFALVCGAESCPALPPEAFEGEALDDSLDEGARLFLNDPSKVSLDPRRRVLRLSPILKWYASDFAEDTEGLIEFVAGYLPEDKASQLRQGNWTVEYTEYDWSLNQAGSD